MTHSWKHTPIYKDGSKRSRNKKFYKKLANKRVRRTKHLHGRKSMYYKEVQDSWSICDYRTYQAESVQMTPKEKENWKRYYFRK